MVTKAFRKGIGAASGHGAGHTGYGGDQNFVSETRNAEHENEYYKDRPHVERRTTGKYNPRESMIRGFCRNPYKF